MRAHCRTPRLSALALVVSLVACDAVDRAREGSPQPDSVGVVAIGSGLMLGLQVPSALDAGSEGVVRLTVTNQSDTVASHIRLELLVPGWVEPMPPRPGDREVSMAAMEDGGTRFAYRMESTPLEPNQTHIVEQRIRVPAYGAQTEDAVPWTRLLRARLFGPGSEPLAEVESEIALQGAALPETGSPAVLSGPGNQRMQLGSARLGMTAAALRQAIPAARDTAWTQEGVARRVVMVPLAEGRVFAVLSGDTVARLEVLDPGLKTREQMGVGSQLEELRAAYGPACADIADGTVIVWFANAPGVSFALDSPVPGNAAQLRQAPERIPASSRVTRWWLRGGADRCPR
ncbi:hypothetical protein BH23GEM6_BH23GEM6_24770 [soil metagenome]